MRYWQKVKWTSKLKELQSETTVTKSCTRVAAGDSPKWFFLEDDQGALLDVGRRTQMRTTSKGIFIEMSMKLGGKTPGTWDQQVPMSWRHQFINCMEESFPELTLCEEHWKAQHFAILAYSMWASKHRHRASQIKTETLSPSIQSTLLGQNTTVSLSTVSSGPVETLSTVAAGKRRADNEIIEDQPLAAKKVRRCINPL